MLHGSHVLKTTHTLDGEDGLKDEERKVSVSNVIKLRRTQISPMKHDHLDSCDQSLKVDRTVDRVSGVMEGGWFTHDSSTPHHSA